LMRPYADAGRGLTVEREDLAVSLGAKFDAADLVQARDLSGAAGFHDHVRELLDIGQAALQIGSPLFRGGENYLKGRRFSAGLERKESSEQQEYDCDDKKDACGGRSDFRR
jgi:hypothetical protein